jgi:hypothetical protein
VYHVKNWGWKGAEVSEMVAAVGIVQEANVSGWGIMAGDFLLSGDLSAIINVEVGGANSPLASKYDGVLRTCSRNSAGSTLRFSVTCNCLFHYLFPYLIIPSSDPDISDIPMIGLTPISLRQHYHQSHYSSAPIYTARIPT